MSGNDACCAIINSIPIFDFRYLDNKVYVSLANGDIVVYTRDHCKFVLSL